MNIKISVKGSQVIVKDEISVLLADSCNILKRSKKFFLQLLSVHVNDVRQIEIHTPEPLVQYLVPDILMLKLLLQSWRSVNFQVVTKSWQSWSKE
jgi:hypothetical protein